MAAFAKLFDLDGIGQVLVTVETADHEDEADHLLRFRIEDMNGMEFRLSEDFDSPRAAQAALSALDAAGAMEAVQPLLSARAQFAAQA